jgi:hypothetical protein
VVFCPRLAPHRLRVPVATRQSRGWRVRIAISAFAHTPHQYRTHPRLNLCHRLGFGGGLIISSASLSTLSLCYAVDVSGTWEVRIAITALVLVVGILLASIAFALVDSRKTPPCFLPGNGTPVCAPGQAP